MGCGFMGRISSKTTYITNPINPSPHNFTIIKCAKLGSFYATMVLYPNCTNFEGKKILVTNFNTRNVKSLDPHFTRGSGLIARFEPTEEGWLLALRLAKSLNIAKLKEK